MRPLVKNGIEFHGKIEDLIRVFETLGVAVEGVHAAAECLGVPFTEGDLHILEHRRMQTLVRMVQDVDFFVRLACDARTYSGRVVLRLAAVTERGHALASAPFHPHLRPQSTPVPHWKNGTAYAWVAVIE